MSEQIIELLRLAGADLPTFTAFDLFSLPIPLDLIIHPDVADYFATCVPAQESWIAYLEILTPETILEENTQLMPCSRLCRHGFVAFLRADGNVFAFDISTGTVHHFSHEVDYGDTSPPDAPSPWRFWHGDAKKPHGGLTRAAIIASAIETYPSFDAFSRKWQKMMRGHSRP